MTVPVPAVRHDAGMSSSIEVMFFSASGLATQLYVVAPVSGQPTGTARDDGTRSVDEVERRSEIDSEGLRPLADEHLARLAGAAGDVDVVNVGSGVRAAYPPSGKDFAPMLSVGLVNVLSSQIRAS
jgi:hypothetical protein